MAQYAPDLLQRLQFELKFLEDGGYGRSPRAPWRPPYIFEDSPSCLNFGDPSRPQPCSECFLLQFVPEGSRTENVPCRFISLTESGETVEHLYRCSTQLALEEVLKIWLRREIARLEGQPAPS